MPTKGTSVEVLHVSRVDNVVALLPYPGTLGGMLGLNRWALVVLQTDDCSALHASGDVCVASVKICI